MEMKKKYLREFDAFGKSRHVLIQNGRFLVPKIWQIDNNKIRMLFKSRNEK